MRWAWVVTSPNSAAAKQKQNVTSTWDVSLQHLIWKHQTTSEMEQVIDDRLPVRQCAATNACREPHEWSKAWFRRINKCSCWTPAAFHCALRADFAGFLKKVDVLYIKKSHQTVDQAVTAYFNFRRASSETLFHCPLSKQSPVQHF